MTGESPRLTSRQLGCLVGVSVRQLDYWWRTFLVVPSIKKRGRRQYYAFTDIVLAKLVAVLRQSGFTLQRVRKLVGHVRTALLRLTFPLQSCCMVIQPAPLLGGNKPTRHAVADKVFLFSGDVIMTADEASRFILLDVRDLAMEVDRMCGTEVHDRRFWR